MMKKILTILSDMFSFLSFSGGEPMAERMAGVIDDFNENCRKNQELSHKQYMEKLDKMYEEEYKLLKHAFAKDIDSHMKNIKEPVLWYTSNDKRFLLVPLDIDKEYNTITIKEGKVFYER